MNKETILHAQCYIYLSIYLYSYLYRSMYFVLYHIEKWGEGDILDCHDGYVGGVGTQKTKFGGEIWIMFNTKAIAAGSNFCSCGSLLHRNQQAMRPL